MNFTDKFRNTCRKSCKGNCAIFEDFKIYDYEIAEFVIKHLKIWHWLNPYKVTTAVNIAFQCLYEQRNDGADPDEVWKELYD